MKRARFPHLPAALRESSVLAVLGRGDATAAAVAQAIGISEVHARTTLRALEAQGRAVVRLETMAEARARVAKLPRVSFSPRRARRLFLYAAVPAQERAA